jgi:YidC/Oxa1 family membrane protein insertase
MERRVLLATVLAFLVLYAYNTYFAPPPPAPEQKAASAPAAPAAAPTAKPESAPSAAPAAAPTPAAPAPQALVSDAREREIVVDTKTIEAVLTNRGGRVLHWRLKQYRDDDGKPLDLVPSELPATQPSPFSLRVDDPAVTARLDGALYRVTGDTNGRVDATTAPATLVFDYQDAGGVVARKELRFEPQNYVVTFSASVTSGGRMLNPTIVWGPGLGDVGALAGGGSFFTGNAVQAPQAIFQRAGKVERVARTKLAEQPNPEAQFRFAGIDDHYFIATALNPGQSRLEYRAVDLPIDGATRQLVSYGIRVAGAPRNVKFYVGPKQFDALRAVDTELVRAINFGIFAWLVLPMLSALKWLHAYTGNYGADIILLTILINLVMFPLRHKSMVSMRKMQGIQPQIKAIQARYADLKMTDPAKQKMNTEIMNLYREKGVNPASGCVPMVLTFPVLFAFYALLGQAIELRGADFGLWIHDLSQHDPYYVTPLLMGVSMFVQTWMSPATADPQQRQMMMVMPVVFTAMFLRLPSGLAIYYLMSNLLQIGQQYFTNRLIGPPPAAAPRPAAERRVKNVGKGRTPAAGENRS